MPNSTADLTARFLGYQIANAKGQNITGDDDDPTSMASFEILSPAAATSVMRQLGGAKRFLLMPIYAGDIEEPTII